MQQLPGQFQTGIHVVTTIQIGIVDQSLPADDGARFFKIGAHHDAQAVGVLGAQRSQLLGVAKSGLGIVQGARANDHQQAGIVTAEDGFNFLTGLQDVLPQLMGQRGGRRQFAWRDQGF